MGFIIALLRFVAFALVSMATIFYYWSTAIFLGHSIERGFIIRAAYIRIMLFVLNVDIKFYGKLPDKKFTGFIVANHRSYFDPVVILRDVDAVTVSKSQVSRWPIVGAGAEIVGVIWVSREEKDSRKTARDKMLELVKKGYAVLIFPEGTSHTGEKMLEVRNATFEMAAQNNFPVLPVAIEYQTPEYAFIGKETFVPHFFKCFKNWKTTVGLYFGEPISGKDVEQLKQEAVSNINKHVSFLRKEIGYGKSV
jgi:1-acyl-sn-glycerol-3-phosphate acyltransferase